MTDFGGYHPPIGEPAQIPYPDNWDDLTERFDFVDYWQGFFVEESFWIPLGTFANNLPVNLLPKENRAGDIEQYTFFDDYYNRIYFLPSRLDFGAITQPTPLTLIVWNAFLGPSDFQELTLINAQGVEVSGGQAAPYTFKPLETVVYTFTASASGPPDLNGTAVWDFDTPYTDDDNYTLSLVGRRARVNPLHVNWKDSYTIEYSFKTEMITSRNGKEQRRSLRQTPRKVIQYTATPWRDVFRAFQELLAYWHNNVVIVGEMPRQVTLEQPLLADDLVAIVEDNDADWLIPGMPVVIENRQQAESRTIDSVVGTSISFNGPGIRDWDAGVKIHPALSGRLAASVSGKKHTDRVAEVSVSFEQTPASEIVLPVPNAPEIFNGREMFLTKFNWGDGVDMTWESEREVVDYGFGRIGVFTPYPFTSNIRKLTFVGRNYAQAKLLLDFFVRCQGQRGEFYMPTWEQDIIIYRDVPSNSSDLRILNTDFYTTYKDSTVYKAIMIRLRDGTKLFRRVQSVVVADDDIGLDSVITVDTSFVTGFTAADVLMISWMPVWRHATDNLSIEWLTNSVAQLQMSFKVLEDLS